jgi:3-isopropylmalate dehydrogenase
LELTREADALEAAVNRALEGGARTPDVAISGGRTLSTREMGDAVLSALASHH